MNSMIFINRIINERKYPRHFREIYLKNTLRANKSKYIIRFRMKAFVSRIYETYENTAIIWKSFRSIRERDLLTNQRIDFHVWRIITRNSA